MRPPPQTKSGLLTVTGVLIVVLFAAANLPWTLDDYDQAKQAFVSYQMVGQQRWLYQTTPTEGLPTTGERHSPFRINTKPPAIGWVSAGIYFVTRSWDLAWRLPSLLSALALALLIFRVAQRAFGDLPAVMATAAFGFNMLSPRLATLVRTDMPLALSVFVAGAIIFSKIRTRHGWQSGDRTLLFGVLAVGLFIKGPIIYAFILPPLLIYELWRKWRSDFPAAWSGWSPWIASFALFAAWVIAGTAFVPGFYHDVVRMEFAARFQEGIHRSQPLLFYIPHLLQKFAPWSIVLVVLCALLLRDAQHHRERPLRRISPEMLWLAAWAVGGITVMSLIPSKRVDRIFPAIPPLCLLLAGELGSVLQNTALRTRVYRICAILIMLSGVFIGSYTAMRLLHGYRENRNVLDKFGSQVRRLARTQGWRYEILRAPDEGLLLYLQRPRFCTLQRASEMWRTASIDSLVARRSDLLEISQWPGVSVTPRLQATKMGVPPTTYIFVTRRDLNGAENKSP